MFKWLFCKHEYKLYNTKVEYPLFSADGHNVFQFVCIKCGDEVNISEIEIRDMLSELQSNYNKSLALDGKSVKYSNIVVERHNDINVSYSSPAVTLMLEYYKNKEETDKVIVDGWFHTGDIGKIDACQFALFFNFI